MSKKMEAMIYTMIRAEKVAAEPQPLTDLEAFQEAYTRWNNHIS
jgi:hypothetical protein